MDGRMMHHHFAFQAVRTVEWGINLPEHFVVKPKFSSTAKDFCTNNHSAFQAAWMAE